MANTKVSDLTAIVTPVDADEIHVAQSGSSLKMTLLQLTQYLDPDNIPLQATTGGLVASNVGDALRELQDEILDILDITDHGALDGLTDDDHTQYSLADGTRDFTGKVIGVDPTSDQHLATKVYVDSVDADSISFTSTTGGISADNVGDALRELQDEIIDNTPAGSDTEIQFNDNGVFGADSGLIWANVNKRFGIGAADPSAKLEVDSGSTSVSFVPDTESTWLSMQITSAGDTVNDTARGIKFASETGGEKGSAIIGLAGNSSGGVMGLVFCYAEGNTTKEGFRLETDGGVFVGAVSGLSKGAGTLNASLYDDGTELTCYVFDAFLDGEISNKKWDALVPGKNILDNKGMIIGKEKPIHNSMRKFKAMLGGEFDPLDIDKYSNFWKTERHLISLPDEETFDFVQNIPIASWVQKLVETVEILAIHIDNVHQRTKSLESA